MTNSARISDIAFPDVAKGSKIRRKATLTNESGQVVNVTGISSSMGYFSSLFTRKVQPNFPASSTIYFRENEVLQNANGEFATTDQGFGVAGTTDEDGKFTPNYALPALSLTAPSAGTKYELEESFNVTWTSSNITLVNVILESESGGSKTYSGVDASLGTLAVTISASDGFSVNETVYIYIENTHQTIDDSVQVASIATLTINSPTLTAGTEGNVTGTSNGDEVDVYYRTSSPEGSWEVFEEGVAVSGGNWSATGTIPAADKYDFKVEDTTDRDGSAQVDDVVVASGVVALQFGGSGDERLTKIEKVGSDYYVAGVTKSPTLLGENTGYVSGWVNFLCKLNASGQKQWVIFGSTSNSRGQVCYDNMAYDTTNNKIFWVSDCVYSNFADYGIYPENNLKRVDTSGNVEATHTSTANNEMFCSICVDGSKVYIHRYVYPNNIYVREIAWNFSTGTSGATDRSVTISTGSATYSINNNKILEDADNIYCAVRGLSPETGYIAKKNKLSHAVSTITRNYMYVQIAQSATRLCVITNDGTNFQIQMIAKSDLSVLYTHNIDTNVSVLTSNDIDFDGTNFILTRTGISGSKYTIYTISDADSYSSTSKDIIPESGAIIISRASSAEGLTCGTIDGKISSDSTDAGGADCFIYDED